MIVGMGELGLHPKELRRYSLQEFMWKIDGMRKVSNMMYKDRWEQTREICFTLAQMSGKQAKSSLTKYHVMQFPWDNIAPKKRIAQLSGQERKDAILALINQSNEAFKNHLNNKN